jgi:hypothetical protein
MPIPNVNYNIPASQQEDSVRLAAIKEKYPEVYASIMKAKNTEGKNKMDDAKIGVGTVVFPGFYRTTIDNRGNVNQVGTGNPLYSGWNVMGINTGLDWQLATASIYPNGTFPLNNAAGTYRLIATGCEVVNTTAALYKGGAVTCYRSPCPKSYMTARTYNSSGDPHVLSLGTFPVGVLPPSNQADASLFPNSRTWGAEDGIYLVGAMNSTDNPYIVPSPGISGLLTPSSAGDMISGTGWVGYLPKILHDNVPTYQNDLSACSTLWNWDISGAIFAGLNANSTMQVTVRYYVERHPSIAEPDLLVLARTPCPYDPTVQEIYARAMHELPVGVPVGMNPLGEWFNEVLEAVAEWAPQLGKAVGNIIPGAQLVGNAAGLGATSWLKQRKNTKGGGGKPSPSGVVTKVKMNNKGQVKEIDTIRKGKKPKYTKAQKRAYQAQLAARSVMRVNGLKAPVRPKGPARRR